MVAFLVNPSGIETDIEVNIGRAGGASLNRERAFTKMFGESVERYCLLPSSSENLIYDSYSRLISEGFVCVDPNTIAAGVENPAPNRRELPFYWSDGFYAKSYEPVKIPTQLIDMPYSQGDDEAILRVSITTGAACGSGIEDAITRGYLELVERDAFMLSWLTMTGLTRINIESMRASKQQGFAKALNEVRRYKLEPEFFQMRNDKNIPCVVCVLNDTLSKIVPFSIGAKCATNFAASILGSLEEAVQLRHWLRTISGEQDENLNQPNTLRERGHMTLRRKYQTHLKKWISLATDSSQILNLGRRINVDHIIEIPEEVVVCDLTYRMTDEIKGSGFNVVKCIAPSLQPLYLTESLHDYAWPRIEKRKSGFLNTVPHPFL